MKTIAIQNHIGIPKYKQIISSIEKAIESQNLKKGDQLPSINKVCLEFALSRDTVLQAYDELKKRGIVFAILGKGYYINSIEIGVKQKIFLLFDELNIFKEDLYNSFLKNVGKQVEVAIFFHHFNIAMFSKLIETANGNYTKYVIMPTNLPNAHLAIKTLPVNDVFILDQTNEDLVEFPSVHQNFIKDIYDALKMGKSKLINYKKLILIFPGFREPIGMKQGFIKFCNDFNFDFEVISALEDRNIELNEVFIIPNDRDLVDVIEQSKRQNLQLGADFGIISYNETPLKKIVENGITTISTNFEEMGKITAKMILENTKQKVENKCNLIIRNSL